MAKLHILGSCSGTEPYSGCHHTALALEAKKCLYFFDAGETCSHTAHLMGLDLLKLRHIFITHPHIDHIGGLANLIWTIHKLALVKKQLEPFTLTVHASEKALFDSALGIIAAGQKNVLHFATLFHEISPGTVFENDSLCIECIKNNHMSLPPNGKNLSYSYRLVINGKKIIISGDVKSINDLEPWLDDCDLLLMETGHHIASEICTALRKSNRNVKDIVFYHHGREILNDWYNALKKAEDAWGGKLRFAVDGMTLTL